MVDLLINLDVDRAQSEALDAVAYYRDKPSTVENEGRLARVRQIYSNIMVGRSVEMTPIEIAVFFNGDPVCQAAVIEYAILAAAHEQAEEDAA